MYDNYSKDGAICPYCGYLNSGWESDGELYDESIDDYYCSSCSKNFLCIASLSWSWLTNKIDETKDGNNE